MPVEALTYPLPRRNRTGPASSLDLAAASSGGLLPAPPRTRVIPFAIRVLGSRRSTLSTPRLIGPALLRKLFFIAETQPDPVSWTIELGWAPTIITETNVVLSTVRPYTTLTELQDPFAQVTDDAGAGLSMNSSTNTRVPYEWTLDLLITEPQFSFVVSWVNASVFGNGLHGHLVILEAMNPDALAVFTGS